MDLLIMKNQTIKDYDVIYSVKPNTAPMYVRKKQDMFEKDYWYVEENTMTPNQQSTQPQQKMFSIAEVRELVVRAWED